MASEPAKRVRLARALRGFPAPDTRSRFEGRLAPGVYDVLEMRLAQGAAADTDYARVAAQGFADEDTWICTRWRDQQYAELFDAPRRSPPPTIDWQDDPLAVPEPVLVARLPSFHDFTYVSTGARYAEPIAGVSLPLAPPLQNNCCTFVEGFLVASWQAAHGEAVHWNDHLHRLMMIRTEDLFGPVSAVVEAGMGIELADSDAPPHPWTLVQGWTRDNRSGHTFIVLDYDAESDRVLTLESNGSNRYRLDGVGCRMLGNLRDLPGGRPPEAWWQSESLRTWTQLRAQYVSRECACLKVTEIGWARGTRPPDRVG